MIRIECPHCTTSYPAVLTGLDGEPGTRFTILCSVCKGAFDGDFIDVSGNPASLLHKISGGLFGKAATEAQTVVTTRKRG